MCDFVKKDKIIFLNNKTVESLLSSPVVSKISVVQYIVFYSIACSIIVFYQFLILISFFVNAIVVKNDT